MITKLNNGYQMGMTCPDYGTDEYNEMIQNIFATNDTAITYAWDFNGGTVTMTAVIPEMEVIDDSVVESELLDVLNG